MLVYFLSHYYTCFTYASVLKHYNVSNHSVPLIVRQQLERTPRRQAEAAKATAAAGVTANTEGQGATGGGNNNNSSSNSLYLLSR